MDRRQIIVSALAGFAGFAAVALGTAYIVSSRQAGSGLGVASIGGPFTLVDDTGAPVYRAFARRQAVGDLFRLSDSVLTFVPPRC